MAEDYKDLIHAREQQIIRSLATTATTGQAARLVCGLPSRVGGLTIVDLGAGACPLTAELIGEGADAYALDAIYEDTETIERALAFSLPWIATQVPEMFKEAVMQATQSAAEAFFRSFTSHRDHYQQGWLTRLPFATSFADHVVSFNGISLLSEDDAVLKAAISEALRITKPGGTFVMAPFHRADTWFREYIVEHDLLLKQLREAQVGHVTIEGNIPTFNGLRLKVIKKE